MTPNRYHLKLATEKDKAHQPHVTIPPKLFKLGTFDNPKEATRLPLPIPVFGGTYQKWWNLPPVQVIGEIDFYSDPQLFGFPKRLTITLKAIGKKWEPFYWVKKMGN